MGLDIKLAYQGAVTHTRSTQQVGQAASDNTLSSSYVGQSLTAHMCPASTLVILCEAKCIVYSQTGKTKTKQNNVGWQAGDPGKPMMQPHSRSQQVEAQES